MDNTQISATNDTDAYFTERFYIGQTVFEGWDENPTLIPNRVRFAWLLGV